MAGQETNRLINEKSPYLLQHAHNPVDWHPWGTEAFAKARREDKPIFLSIGYSTCHWCHVMEKESFEDSEVARLLNSVFVPIKVDREERPDLDHVYMTVCQLLTGGGGWPLNIVLTPQKKPFFAATYIPKESRYGRVGLLDLVPRIGNIWANRREEVLNSADKIIDAFQKLETGGKDDDLDEKVLDQAATELIRRFDEQYGGFGGAPKFPSPHTLCFLLRYWRRTGYRKALAMVEKTLQSMRLGGLFDHAGYGFHRYSTDREWLVPHFEKMLYDQALLTLAYLEAFQAGGEKLYADTAKKILSYVRRELEAPAGGFYAAEDADSEGVEGKFYVWEEKEIRRILDKETGDLLVRAFGVTAEGNYLNEATKKADGTNILHLKRPAAQLAREACLGAPELEERLAAALDSLRQVREQRVHPHKDDKILTDWNGLMIAAFARGAQILGDSLYAQSARKAADFVLRHLSGPDKRLLHRYRDGEAGIYGQLDDYAFLVWGLIELYQATFETTWLREAVSLNQKMLKHFRDPQNGGFFFTADDGEQLIVRKKELYDGALPSGNAVALNNLLRLGRLTGNPALTAKAAATIRAFGAVIKQSPSAYTHFLSGLDFALGPAREVVIAGDPEKPETTAMLTALRKNFLPNMVVIFRPASGDDSELDKLASFVAQHKPLGGRATAYVCTHNACKEPTSDVAEMLKMLSV